MHPQSISQVWDQVTGVQTAPSTTVLWITVAIAVLTVAPRPVWHYTRNVVTIAHEGGHGLAAVLTGRRLQGVRLHSDTSGLTVSSGKPHGPGMVLTAAAGYAAPPVLGLAGAWLISGGHITALLWAVVLLLAALLVMIRNAYGALTVVLTGGVCFAVSWFGDAELQGAFAYLSVWFLLLAGVRPVVELQYKRRHGGAPDSDADQLGRLTRSPGLLWVSLFLVTALACLATGARWLLTR